MGDLLMVTRTLLSILVATTLLAAVSHAQWEVDGPRARMFVDGRSAAVADPIGHDIAVAAPGLLRLDITSGDSIGAGVVLVVANVEPTGAAIAAVPGLGIINLGVPGLPVPTSLAVIADGISYTANAALDPYFSTTGVDPVLTLAYSVSAAQIGLRLAVQCVIADPLAAPFGLDLTQCADVTVVAGQQVLVATGASGHGFVAFPSGRTFPFHGLSYTGMWVGADGFVSFGNAPTVPAPSLAMPSRSFVFGPPAIAAWWSDFDPTANGGLGVAVRAMDDEMLVVWGHTETSGSASFGLPHAFAGGRSTFEIALSLAGASSPPGHVPGRFEIRFGELSDVENALSSYGLVGHTPGGQAALINVSDTEFGFPRTAPLGVPMIEEHSAVRTTALLGFDGLGSPRRLNDMRSWENRSITFTPSPLIAPTSYVSASLGAPASTVTSTTGNSISPTGGQLITLAGRFHRFDVPGGSLGSVTLDPSGAALPATVIGVLDGTASLPRAIPHDASTSPLRDGEGLVISPPPLPPGYAAPDVELRVHFADGTIEDIRVAIAGATLSSTYLMSGVDWIRYDLRALPVRFYSQSHDRIWISRDGRITMVRPPSTLPINVLSVVNPGATGPTPTIAAAWSMLNGAALTVTVIEDLNTNLVTVRWTGGVTGINSLPFGPFEARLHPNGHVVIDLSGLIVNGSAGPPFVFGVSDQGPGPNLFQISLGSSALAAGASYALIRSTSIPLTSQLYSTVLTFLYDAPLLGYWTTF